MIDLSREEVFRRFNSFVSTTQYPLDVEFFINQKSISSIDAEYFIKCLLNRFSIDKFSHVLINNKLSFNFLIGLTESIKYRCSSMLYNILLNDNVKEQNINKIISFLTKEELSEFLINCTFNDNQINKLLLSKNPLIQKQLLNNRFLTNIQKQKIIQSNMLQFTDETIKEIHLDIIKDCLCHLDSPSSLYKTTLTNILSTLPEDSIESAVKLILAEPKEKLSKILEIPTMSKSILDQIQEQKKLMMNTCQDPDILNKSIKEIFIELKILLQQLID